MNKSLLGLLSVLCILSLAACASSASYGEAYVCPEVQLTMSAEGETVVRFGMRNDGSADYAGDRSFHGELYLFDETQMPLTRQTIESLGPVVAHKAVLPGEFTASLPPGDYHLTYYTKTWGFAEADFCVIEQDGVRCLEDSPLRFESLNGFTVTDIDWAW